MAGSHEKENPSYYPESCSRKLNFSRLAARFGGRLRRAVKMRI
jgi:hypothetical protein